MAKNSAYDPTEDLLQIGRNLEAIHSRYLTALTLDEPDVEAVESDRLHLLIERALEELERAFDCSLYRSQHNLTG